MKKLVLLLILCSFSFAAFNTFESLRDYLNTPARVQRYLSKYISYNFNPYRTPYRTARLTYQTGWAGCTDCAQFAYEVLTYHGYKVALYEVWSNTRGHAFAVVANSDGTYTCISAYRPTTYRFKYVKSIAKWQYPDMVGWKYIKGSLE